MIFSFQTFGDVDEMLGSGSQEAKCNRKKQLCYLGKQEGRKVISRTIRVYVQ